jgi:hypothetical protein
VNVRAGRQVSGGAREIEPLPDALAASRVRELGAFDGITD